MSDIGILGGTFDPFHTGHLTIAESALDSAGMSKVLVIPAKVSPFKQGREMADEKDRLAMARAAVERCNNVEVSTVELESKGVSYTFRTLTTLHKMHPYDTYWLIVGSDQFINLESWFKGRDILQDFQVILARRPGYKDSLIRSKIEKYTTSFGTAVRVMNNELLDISSTDIKERIRNGERIDGLVPDKVAEYINEHGLYRTIHNR